MLWTEGFSATRQGGVRVPEGRPVGYGSTMETWLQYSKVTVLTRRYSFRAASPARQHTPLVSLLGIPEMSTPVGSLARSQMKNQGPREATYPTQVIPVVSYRFGLQCKGMQNQSGAAILVPFLPPYHIVMVKQVRWVPAAKKLSSCPPCDWNLLYIFFLLLPTVSAMTLAPKGPPPSKN